MSISKCCVWGLGKHSGEKKGMGSHHRVPPEQRASPELPSSVLLVHPLDSADVVQHSPLLKGMG